MFDAQRPEAGPPAATPLTPRPLPARPLPGSASALPGAERPQPAIGRPRPIPASPLLPDAGPRPLPGNVAAGRQSVPAGPAAQRPVAYRGLPRPVRFGALLAVAVGVGVVVGATAPGALMRLGATAYLRPGMLDWYTVRALGFLSYFAIAGSVLYGLLLSTKILDAIAHRPVSFALHKDLSIVGLILIAVHGLLLLGDASYSFSLRSILVPFASPYAPVAVGIGQLAFYGTAVVTASFYVRRRIGQSMWRLIHYATFLTFVGGTAHGIFSGSDSGTPWAFWVYLIPTAAAIFLTVYRVVTGISARRNAAPRSLATIVQLAGPLDRPGAAG